jgi:5-formyltetrahydrofolate cyclo-ligase
VFSTMATKNLSRAQLRLAMLETRSQIGSDKIGELNRALSKNLSFVWSEAEGGLGESGRKPLWAAYKSFSWEADPSQSIAEATPYVKWAYPKIYPDSKLEFFVAPESESSSNPARWLKNSFGIWEPDPVLFQKISLDECVGVLIPGVAFDRQGQRLGYGKGFYDRALANYRGLKVGVCFSMQVTAEALSREAHDVAMDLVVTDKEIIRAGQMATRLS